jgi:hypothetical protein
MYKKHKHQLITDFNRHTDNIFYKCNKLTTIALHDRFYFTAYVCALYYILSDSDFNSYLCDGKRNDNQEQRTELKLSINILMKKRFYIIYVRQRDNFIQRLIDERYVDNCESRLSSNIWRR